MAYLYLAFVLKKVGTVFSVFDNHHKVMHFSHICHSSVNAITTIFIFHFSQKGQLDRTQSSGRRDKGKMYISKEDIMCVSSDI